MTALSSDSRVCALIPHYRCEQWLGQAIESLLEQTRPPDAIVVIDDASEHPPVETVEQYPEVTLLAAAENSGPYRLVQAVIDATRFDAYLFQDADDWSASDRLQILLSEAAATGAELIGSHEVRVLVDQGDVIPVRYPLDVNAELRDRPTAFPLLHPTSLISRTLVCRLGGFATGMRFSGDAELLRRAGHVARIINADHFGYFRRKRQGSLTLGSDTALGSPARLAVQEELGERATRNAALVARGESPDLEPLATAPRSEMLHVAGPPLGASRPVSQRRVRSKGHASEPPVFLVGAPRSGHTILGWALAQHPALSLLPDSRWLARIAGDVEARAEEEAAPTPPGFREAIAASLANLEQGSGGRRLVASGVELLDAAHALDRLFPGCSFIHVVRDPEENIAALVSAPASDGEYYSPDAARRAWIAAVEKGLLLEEALGQRVRRIEWEALRQSPEASVASCLDFIGEAATPACNRPFADVPRPDPADALRGETTAATAAVLVRLQETGPTRTGNQEARKRLAEAFRRGHQPNGSTKSVLERLRALVEGAVPEGSGVAVVSRGDDRLMDFVGRRAWHLPQVEGGVYAGHHPSDDVEALDHLGRLCERGADHLVIPAPSLWWLTFYEGLRQHLEERATLVAFHEATGAVFRLRRIDPQAVAGKPVPARFIPVSPTPGRRQAS